MRFICKDKSCGYIGVRALTFRKNARFQIKEGRLYHFSVGAVVFCQFREEAERRILLLRRATHPVGVFTIPSDHWDLPDRRPLYGAKREVKEETGLTSLSSWHLESGRNQLLKEGCRRACDHHYWHFYSCVCSPQFAALRLRVDRKRKVIGESDMIAWVPISQVLRGRFRLTKPAGYFIGRMCHKRIKNTLKK